MSDETPLERARTLAAVAFDAGSPDPAVMTLILSWSAYLEHVAEAEDDRADEWVSAGYARDLEGKLRDVRILLAAAGPDFPSHEIRQLYARVHDQELPELSPEEPEPGRDWTRVEAAVFTANGKFKYQVFLDYTGERHRGLPGEGPSGWHHDGHMMARRALARATLHGTSEVTFDSLPEGWTLFVADPPQGYPHCVTASKEDR